MTQPAERAPENVEHGGAEISISRQSGSRPRLRFAVASVNYGLVPSVTYPAPVYDLKAAVRWLRANAADYGLDPDRIATGGASSGRHLASLALTASDERLAGNIGDDLGVSSPVSAVVAYSPAVTCSYPAGATRWRLRWHLRRLRRCLGSTGSTMRRSVATRSPARRGESIQLARKPTNVAVIAGRTNSTPWWPG